ADVVAAPGVLIADAVHAAVQRPGALVVVGGDRQPPLALTEVVGGAAVPLPAELQPVAGVPLGEQGCGGAAVGTAAAGGLGQAQGLPVEGGAPLQVGDPDAAAGKLKYHLLAPFDPIVPQPGAEFILFR